MFPAVLLLMLLSSMCLGDGSKLVPGDMVGVTVDGEKEFTKPYQINKDGCISMPMVGTVKIAEMTASDASVAVRKALTRVLVDPQVTVVFIDRAKMRIFVVGQVKNSGLMEVGAGDKVLQALAQAGYDDTADLSHINVRRGDQTLALDLAKYVQGQDLSSNIELQSGDTVVVPRSDMMGTVVVSGQVSKPGIVPIKRGMTFREVIGLVGGVLPEGDTDKITIRRDGVAEPLKLDYKQAMAGDKAADLPLQPADTINVPELETSFFTVIGSVNRPGQYPLRKELSLSEAIGLAGGPIPNIGDIRKVQLIRLSTEDPKLSTTTRIDLTKVMKNPSEEYTVKRGDVIYIAEHSPKMTLFQAVTSLLPLAWVFR